MWVKSSHCASRECLEWRKSRYSGGTNCLEVRNGIQVRYSGLGNASPVITFTSDAWTDFIAGLK